MKLFVGVKTWTWMTTVALAVAVFLGFAVHGQFMKPEPPPPPCSDVAGVFHEKTNWTCSHRQTLTAERLWAGVYFYRCTCKR